MRKKQPYQPAGKILPLIAAIQAEPMREFLSSDAAEMMHCDIRAVSATVKPAADAGFLFLRVHLQKLRIRGTPYQEIKKEHVPEWTPVGDIRIPQVVPGWFPPRMVAPREGT
jgi:hypothetical protein